MPRPSRRGVLQQLGGVAVAPLVATGRMRRSTSVTGSDRDTGGTTGRTDDHVQWYDTFGGGDFSFGAMTEADGGILLVGGDGSGESSTAWVAEVDADGTERWTTTVEVGYHPNTSHAPVVVDAVADDGGYTVLGMTVRGPRIWLVRLDAEGGETWRRRLQGPQVRPLVLRATDDGYLLGGRRHRDGGDAWLLATDARGRRRWQRSYDASTVVDVLPWDGGFLLAGEHGHDAWLRAVGDDGAPGWRHTYGGVGSEHASVALPVGEGVLYGGAAGSTAGSDGSMLVRTTSDGDLVWRRTYGTRNVVALLPVGERFAFTGDLPFDGSRDPEKPVHVVDRWGRVRETVTVRVDSGGPEGMAQFDDGSLAVGGWSTDDGIWLAKLVLDGATDG